jgi:hypothetical protein
MVPSLSDDCTLLSISLKVVPPNADPLRSGSNGLQPHLGPIHSTHTSLPGMSPFARAAAEPSQPLSDFML